MPKPKLEYEQRMSDMFEFYSDKWKTKEGNIINIKDMNNNHLINTIKMIKRNDSNSFFIGGLEKEAKNRNLQLSDDIRTNEVK